MPAFTKFLALLAEKDYINKKILFPISKEQFISSLWFGQSFRSFSSLFYLYWFPHCSLWWKPEPRNTFRMATVSLDTQHYKPGSEICLFKSSDQTHLPCIKYKLFERYLRAKFGLVFPFMFYGLWKFSLLNYQSILWSSTVPRKRGTEEKDGGGSLIHKAPGWKPDLQSSWGMVEFVSPKARECLPFCRRAGGFEIGSQHPTAVVICVVWACHALDNAPNPAPRCLERVVKACCDYSSHNRQILWWWSWTAQKQAWWLQFTSCLLSWCRPRKMAFFFFFLISLAELISTEEEKPI